MCNITAARRRVFPVVLNFGNTFSSVLCGPAGGAQTPNAPVFRGVDFGFWSKLGVKCHFVGLVICFFAKKILTLIPFSYDYISFTP